MKKTIAIKDINWKFYPRAEYDKRAVEAYRAAIDSLPPIAVNKNLVGIDGFHRCQAFKEEGLTEIPAIIEAIPDGEVLVEAIKRNAIHGIQLAMSDKRRLAAQLYPSYPEPKVDGLAELLSVHPDTIRDWTKKLRDAAKQEEDRKIWDMWLACATQEEIGKAVGLTQQAIAVRITKITESPEIGNPDPLCVYNVWNFSKCDDRFGREYPGRIPGQIIANALYYYTKPLETVVDLFGGGGTTVDVCKHMARRYRVYDIAPIDDSIHEHDATTGFPAEAKGCNLVFLDPPYWSQNKGKYGKQPTNLANLSAEDFHETLAKIIKGCLKAVADGGYVAAIIGPTQEKWQFEDHAAELIVRVGVPFHRISVPYSTEIHGGNYVKMAKDNGQWLYLNRDLLIWRKP